MNSWTFTSLFSWGKYFNKKITLNSSHFIGPDSTCMLSFYFVYHTCKTSLNCYENNNAFSLEVTLIVFNTMYTPLRNPWGSSPTIHPRKIGGLFITMSLNIKVIVLSKIFTLGLIRLFTLVFKARDRESISSLVSQLVVFGGTTRLLLPQPTIWTWST